MSSTCGPHCMPYAAAGLGRLLAIRPESRTNAMHRAESARGGEPTTRILRDRQRTTRNSSKPGGHALCSPLDDDPEEPCLCQTGSRASTDEIEALLKAVDAALYDAKRAGRNQVRLGHPPPPPVARLIQRAPSPRRRRHRASNGREQPPRLGQKSAPSPCRGSTRRALPR